MNLLPRSVFLPKTLQKVSFALFLLAAAGIGIQHFLKPSFNNFKVFEAAFHHLIQLKNLYDYYPAEHEDQFLYAPPAAVWLGLLSIGKTSIAIVLWNVCTAMTLWFAIYHLPVLDLQTKNYIAFFSFIELTTSLHNLQTNPLLTAMILSSFIFLERNQTWKSHFITALAFFTKGISGAGIVLMLFYQSFIQNCISFLVAFILVAALPALFVGFYELPRLYVEWIQCLKADHVVNDGISVIGLVHQNINAHINAYVIQLAGLSIFLIDLFYIRWKKEDTFGWRLFVLSFILIWMVLFNHAAESSGYIFAVSGAAIWLFTKKWDTLDKVVFYLVVFFSILAPTDLYPRVFREFLFDHSFKALPILLVWIKMHVDLFNPASPFDLKEQAAGRIPSKRNAYV